MNTDSQTEAHVLIERLVSQGGYRFTPGGGDWRWQLMSRGVPSIARTLTDAMENAYMASSAEIFVYRIVNGAHVVTQTVRRTEVEAIGQSAGPSRCPWGCNERDFFKATARFCELRIQTVVDPKGGRNIWAMTDEEFSIYVGPDDLLVLNAISGEKSAFARSVAVVEKFGRKGPAWLARAEALMANQNRTMIRAMS